MKKFYLLFLAGTLLFSCAKDDEIKAPNGEDDVKKESVSFVIQGFNSMKTRTVGNPGGQIVDPVALDSLIKNVRILVFTPTSGGVCTAYADFDSIRLSQDNVLEMTVATGVQDFIVLTNVLGNVMTTTSAPMVIPTSPIGRTRAQILASLPLYQGAYPSTGASNPAYGQAAQIFFDELNGVSVTAGVLSQQNVSLVRIISQLTTRIDKTQAFTPDGVTQHAAYITQLGRIAIRNSSPDINMVRLPNNRVSSNISASNIYLIGNNVWTPELAPSAYSDNMLLSFPTEPVGLKPFVIIEATVDPADLLYVADPGNAANHTRYWALQVPNKYLRQNVILELQITKLKGPGSLVPPTPGATSNCEFTVKVYDWDGTPDEDSGEATN